jgi:hypothetical protein
VKGVHREQPSLFHGRYSTHMGQTSPNWCVWRSGAGSATKPSSKRSIEILICGLWSRSARWST